MDGFDTDGLRDDLGDLPQYLTEIIGPAGETAAARAEEMGLDSVTCRLVGEAADAAGCWKKTEAEFRAEWLGR